MSATLIHRSSLSTPEHRKLALPTRLDVKRSTGERVTIEKLWPEALPFLYLVAIVAIIVYVVTAS
jgi:hypothetical protein